MGSPRDTKRLQRCSERLIEEEGTPHLERAHEVQHGLAARHEAAAALQRALDRGGGNAPPGTRP